MFDRSKGTRFGLRAWIASAALLFPLTSLAQSYTSFDTYGNTIVALGSDGFAYNPVNVVTNSSGTAGSGLLPGQSVPMAQLVVATGTGGNCTGAYTPQVIGRSAQTGYAYLVSYQDGNCNWQYGGILPGQTVPFSKIATVPGWAVVNGTLNNDLLQVIGLGASDGLAYLAAYQDTGGVWHSGGVLPGQIGPLSSIWTARGHYAEAQVIGKAASDGRLYVIAWQDRTGNWHAGQLLPGQGPGYTALDWGWGDVHGSEPYGNLQLVGVGTDSYLYLTNWQASETGVWNPGGVLPGGTITAFRDIVAAEGHIRSSRELQVGGIGASDHLFRMTSWQDGGGVWHPFSPVAPVLQVPVQKVDYTYTGPVGTSNLTMIGLGDNSRFYVLAWQDTNGVWHGGTDITP